MKVTELRNIKLNIIIKLDWFTYDKYFLIFIYFLFKTKYKQIKNHVTILK